MQVEVAITRTERVKVDLTSDQIRAIANEKTNLVLETLTDNARNQALRKYAEKLRKTKEVFPKNAQFFILGKDRLYQRDGRYDYHNDVDNDLFLGELTMTDLDEYSITCAKIAEACLLLGHNNNGK